MTEEMGLIAQPERRITAKQFAAEIEEARQKAKLLRQIVDSQHLYQTIGTKKHLYVEAWETIAKGYGYIPDIEWTRKAEEGGWEAKAVLKDWGGNVVAGAEAECGTLGDSNWLGRPSFQQRSMAQTRAVGKVCRIALAWVVVLAGYAPTPAEEMDTGSDRSSAKAKPIPKSATEAPPIKSDMSWSSFWSEALKIVGVSGEEGRKKVHTAIAESSMEDWVAKGGTLAAALTMLRNLYNQKPAEGEEMP